MYQIQDGQSEPGRNATASERDLFYEASSFLRFRVFAKNYPGCDWWMFQRQPAEIVDRLLEADHNEMVIIERNRPRGREE